MATASTRTSFSDVQSLQTYAQSWNFDLIFKTLPSAVSTEIKELKYRCKTSALPGMTIDDVLIELHGVSVNRPGRKTFSHHFTATFVDSMSLSCYHGFMQWSNLIHSWENNSRAASSVAMVEASIIVYGDDATTIAREIQLSNVWPQDVPELSFDGAASNAIEPSITFSFDHIRGN